ncbi:MAG: hypothetical protein IT555_16420 [Acetobacteraceae bacterium]|nr:hypothetical protein [Acetobacteraceae bacterium]
MEQSRRGFLLAGGALMVGAAGDDAVARAAAWLRAWDSQGIHRTATAGDQAGADWLAGEARAIGGEVGFEAFDVSRIDVDVAFVEIEGERIAGEKMFDSPDTPDGRVMALASVGPGLGDPGEGDVHVLELPPTAVYSPEFSRFRRETKSKALVVITKGQAPGLAVLNAEAFTRPFGPPILLVPSTEAEKVIGKARRGAALRVSVRSRRTPAQARNVVVAIAGRDRAREKLVVMTPRSSWWQSTSERGGGLVCWLETLRALRANPPGRDVVMTANSGHELGHTGLDDFLARRAGWDKAGAAIWIHYGANIGAAGGELFIQSNADDLRALFQGALTQAGRAADRLAGKDVVPNGETRDIHLAGGHYLTLVGSNRLFHLPQDRFPDAVDVPAIARIAAGSAAAVVALSR